jgi:hypothetical protein
MPIQSAGGNCRRFVFVYCILGVPNRWHLRALRDIIHKT